MEPRASYKVLRRPILVNFFGSVRGYGILVCVNLTRCERRLGILIHGTLAKDRTGDTS